MRRRRSQCGEWRVDERVSPAVSTTRLVPARVATAAATTVSLKARTRSSSANARFLRSTVGNHSVLCALT